MEIPINIDTLIDEVLTSNLPSSTRHAVFLALVELREKRKTLAGIMQTLTELDEFVKGLGIPT